MLKTLTKKALPLLLGLALLGPVLLFSHRASASNPSTINFQGKVVNSDGTNVADGTYSFIFRIYNTSSPTPTTACTSDAACLWQETQASVSVTSGVFQVELGSSCSLTSGSCNNSTGGPINFASNNALYLTMQFNGDTSGTHGGFMWPVIHITSVPFSLQADNSSTLDGLSSGNFVQLAQGVQNDSSTTNSSIYINKTNASGSPDLLQLQKSSSDVFTVGNTGATTITNTSSTAFKVQGAASVLTIDTTNSLTNVQGINSVATFSSELLNQPPPNNNFNNATYWTLGTGWGSASATQVTATNSTGTLATTASNLTISAGATYQVVFTISGYSGSGCLESSIGGSSSFEPICANVSDETELITTSGTGQLTFTPSGNFSGIVSSVSVKQLTQSANPVVSVNNSNGTAGIVIRAGGSGLNNAFIGLSSGATNTTGANNSAFGFDSLSYNSSGSYNTAIGNCALCTNTTGTNNTGIGSNVLASNTIGSYNVAVGDSALGANIYGTGNTALGNSALYHTNNNENVALGDSAGYANITGYNNTFLGPNAGANPGSFDTLSNLNNSTSIGFNSQVQQSNSLILGGQGANAVNVGIGTTSPTNTFSVSPDIYDTGTASVTSGTAAVTGSGTTWTSSMAGMEFIFADGKKYTIQSVGSATSITLSSNATATESGSSYRIHNPAFYVSSTGSAGIRTSTDSTTAFQIQSASNDTVLNVNTSAFQVELGKASQTDGVLVFYSSAGSNKITLTTSGNPLNNYLLDLPSSGATGSQCLQSDSGSTSTNTVLIFASCSTGGGDNGFVNSVAVTDFNLQDVAASTSVTGTTWTASGSNPTNVTLAISDASASTKGSVTTGSQTFAGVKTFQDFVILQPAASMTAGQTALTQTLTNASSTGGTVNGYSQTITVSNTSSASTTNGFNISLTDNTAGSLTNTNTGVKISLGGSNSNQTQIGLSATVNHGIGVSGSSSGGTAGCGVFSVAAGICGQSSTSGGSGVGTYGYANAAPGILNDSTTGGGVIGVNTGTASASNTYAGVKGLADFNDAAAYNAVGVYGAADAGAGATVYGGRFELIANGATAGAALYATNSTVAGNILQLQDNTTSVFTVGDGGLITLQPAANLTAGQTEVAQTLTNGSSTGGTINGYSQTITVSNTSSISTTNGFNISLTDNTSLGNTNTGIKISLAGSNASQAQYGVNAAVNSGIGLKGSSTGGPGNSNVTCGNSTGPAAGVCGDTTVGAGVLGYTNSSTGSSLTTSTGTGALGYNYQSSGTAGKYYAGLKGISDLLSNAAAYTSLGVYGKAQGGSGATAYGGYFDLGSSSATAGAALYATNGSASANIFDLQDNTTSVFTVGDGGLITLQPAANLTAGQTEVAQTLTNASSTGGTVNGYSQTITVSNTSSASTTNGFNISLTDNATTLANTNIGLKISEASGSNTSQIQIGEDISVARGIAVRAISTGAQGSNVSCADNNLSVPVAICADSQSNTGAGLYARASAGVSGTIGSIGGYNGVASYGKNTGSPLAGSYTVGVEGASFNIATTGSSIGVLGTTKSGSGNTAYGGYFTFDSTSTATAGAALYATNSTVAANIMQLQNNGVNAMVVNSSGNVVLGQSNTGGANGTIVFDNSSGTGTATITLAGNPSTNFTYQLPTQLTINTGDCLQAGTVSAGTVPLQFGSCSTGGGTSLSVNGSAVGSTGNLQNTSGTTSVAATTFTNTSGNITLTVAAAGSGASGIVTATGTQTFDGTKIFSGAVTVQSASGLTVGTSSNAGTIALFNGTNSVSIQGAGSTSAYTIILPASAATAAGQCLTSTGSNGTLQWLSCGASSTASISLVPEFVGAVMTPDGANNSGTMTSDFCGNDGAGSFPDLNTGVCNTSGDFHNYYNWTSNGANDYDIFVRWRVPTDFSSFSTVQFNSKKSATGDDVKLTIYTNSGAVCGTATSMTNTASAWQTTSYTISGCSPAAGDTLIFDVHMAVAANGNTVQMGEIPITYSRN